MLKSCRSTIRLINNMVCTQIQEGRRRLPKSKHGALWDCRGDEGDNEEHGRKAAQPSAKSESQQLEEESRRRPGERPQLPHRFLLALFQLLLLVFLRPLRRGGSVIPAQPQRSRLPGLLHDDDHSSHRRRARRNIAGRLRYVRCRPGSDGSREGSRDGCGLVARKCPAETVI